MGYTTKFNGVLKFKEDPSIQQLRDLQNILGEDIREHKDWAVDQSAFCSYIDLEVTEDFDGIRWDGSEKSYGMWECVNVVIREMRKKWPEFGLAGSLIAQGEDSDDQWLLEINDEGWAIKRDVPPIGIKVRCPSCGHKFRHQVEDQGHAHD